MRIKKKNLCTLLVSGLCCVTILSGCGGNPSSSGGEAGGNAGTEDSAAEDLQMSTESLAGAYKPSELTIPSQESYDYPFMGLKFALSQSLRERMDKKEVAMIDLQEATEDETAVRYALISWKAMTEEQRDQEVQSGGNQFYDWVDTLTSIGTIGVYQEEAAAELDKLTGCTEHNEIGRSEDGKYTYYLSTNPDADSALLEEINNISYEFTDLVPLQEFLEMEGQQEEAEADSGNIGEFSTQDITGKTYSQEMFKDYDLTMVNVFTTWCTPCVNEIPDLQKLHEELAGKGVNVVGVVLDCVDGTGSADEEVVEKAKILAERTGASYPFLIPDQSYFNGRLVGIEAVPETFFVDKEGNIVGETYSGSHSLEEWKEIVEKELEGAVK